MLLALRVAKIYMNVFAQRGQGMMQCTLFKIESPLPDIRLINARIYVVTLVYILT